MADDKLNSAWDSTSNEPDLLEQFMPSEDFRAPTTRRPQQIVERVVEVEKEVIPTNALLYQDDGSIVHDRFQITPTGAVLPDDLTDEEWQAIGRVIKTIESAGMWAAGDWAALANKKWGKTYEEIATHFDYHPDTLKVYAHVCRNINPLIRNQRLPFSHHRAVAKLKSGEQEKALAKGFDENGKPLSLDDFKAVLRGKRKALPAPSGAVGEWDKRYVRFAKTQYAAAKKMKPQQRKSMAAQLRELADAIEGLE